MKKTVLLLIAIVTIMTSTTFSQQQEKDQRVHALISTDMGDIKVVLFDETPLHRDNFVKLAKEGYYNGSIFHRVINTFMIQGGGGSTGVEDPGYTVPAEFVSKYFHKSGALCAARMPDQVNPGKASSGSQFYIVHGRTFGDDELNALEMRTGKKLSEEQRAAYKKLGGAPHLDGDYTVYGEVVEGMDVVDRIAGVTTGDANRPVKDIKMTVKILD